MFFSQVEGHLEIKKKLKQTVAQNRISHAQMFTGGEGGAALPLAMAYARYILCQNPSEDDSCGQCTSCKQITAHSYPDLHYIYPVAQNKEVKDTKPTSDLFLKSWNELIDNQTYFDYMTWISHIDVEKKNAEIKVREAENLSHQLALKSYSGQKRIIILWMAEKLRSQTANKILKMVEEPPADTIFLMVSHKPELVISTIISRCQLINVPRFTHEQIVSILNAQPNGDPFMGEIAAALAEGNAALARNLVANSEDYLKSSQQFITWIRACFQAKTETLLDWSEALAKSPRERIIDTLNYFGKILKTALNSHYQEVKSPFRIESGFQLDKLAPYVHTANIPQMLKDIEDTTYAISRNANAKICLYDLSLNMSRLVRMKKAAS